jgi:hypothetical protein
MNLLPEGTIFFGCYLLKKVSESCEKFEMLHYFVRPIAEVNPGSHFIEYFERTIGTNKW